MIKNQISVSLQKKKKWCGLILDEMKVKQNLVYSKFTGAVIGFTNLGSINNKLLQLEHDCQADEPHTSVATQFLVVMVIGNCEQQVCSHSFRGKMCIWEV